MIKSPSEKGSRQNAFGVFIFLQGVEQKGFIIND